MPYAFDAAGAVGSVNCRADNGALAGLKAVHPPDIRPFDRADPLDGPANAACLMLPAGYRREPGSVEMHVIVQMQRLRDKPFDGGVGHVGMRTDE